MQQFWVKHELATASFLLLLSKYYVILCRSMYDLDSQTFLFTYSNKLV